MANAIITPTGQSFQQNANTSTVSLNPGYSSTQHTDNTAPKPTASTAVPITPSTQSTTTLSNGNKISQVPGIMAKTTQLSQTGVTTDPHTGIATTADGKAYNPTPPGWDAQSYANFKAANPDLEPTAQDTAIQNGTQANPSSISNGGYVDDTYYPKGATLPKDPEGNYPTLTPTSSTDDQIVGSINKELERSDAATAGILSSIQSNYGNLIQQQELANKNAQSQIQTSLLMGGASGAGSSAQYAPISSAGIMASQVNAGIQQIATLNNQEQVALATATKAGQDQDFQLQDKLNTEISTIRDQKVAAATKLNDDITAASQHQQQYALDVAKFNEDVKGNAFNQQLDSQKFAETVKSDAFDRAYKAEDLALRKNQASTSTSTPPSVSATPSGTPDKASQAQFLASLPGGPTGAMATGIKGLTSYTILPTTFSSRIPAGQTESQRQQFVTMAQQYDPSYDENLAPARAAYLKSLQSGTLSQGLVSANKAIAHLQAFDTSIQALHNGSVSSALNPIGQAIKSPFSQGFQQNKSNAETIQAGLKDELAKFFKGTGSTDVSSIDTWSKNLNVANTPGAEKGTVQGALTLMAGQLDSLNQQYTSTIGHPPDGSILQPATLQKLSQFKNQGYDVDIPGVLYTDPKAYVTHDPSGAANLKQVISAYPNLSQADALQLAQSLDQ